MCLVLPKLWKDQPASARVCMLLCVCLLMARWLKVAQHPCLVHVAGLLVSLLTASISY